MYKIAVLFTVISAPVLAKLTHFVGPYFSMGAGYGFRNMRIDNKQPPNTQAPYKLLFKGGGTSFRVGGGYNMLVKPLLVGIEMGFGSVMGKTTAKEKKGTVRTNFTFDMAVRVAHPVPGLAILPYFSMGFGIHQYKLRDNAVGQSSFKNYEIIPGIGIEMLVGKKNRLRFEVGYGMSLRTSNIKTYYKVSRKPQTLFAKADFVLAFE